MEEEIIVNEKGGKQHKVEARYDLIPAKPIDRVAVVLGQGCQRYGKDNWMLIELNDHINHAINHLYKFLSGDRSEDHLTNAICRTLFSSYLAHDGDMHGLYCKPISTSEMDLGSTVAEGNLIDHDNAFRARQKEHEEYEDTFPVDKNTGKVHLPGRSQMLVEIETPLCNKQNKNNKYCDFIAGHTGPCNTLCEKTDNHTAEPCSFLATHDGPCSFNIPF